MKKSEMYKNIMKTLEVIHQENVALGRMFIMSMGGQELHADTLEKQWNDKFKKARKDTECQG